MPAFNVGDLAILQYPDHADNRPYVGALAVVLEVVRDGADYWVKVLEERQAFFLCAPHQLRRPDVPEEKREAQLEVMS